MFLKQYLKHLALSLVFYLILGFVFLIYLTSKNNLNFISGFHLLRFDALHYESIKDNGYHESWLCAFFPGFPFLWKLLSISSVSISVFNAFIFILASTALSFHYKLDWKRQLFFLSIPSLIFMFVPYTESLFYLSTVIVLISLKNNKFLLLLLGLLLASLIRPTTFVFIPSILGAYFFATTSIKNCVTKSFLPIIILVVGLFLTFTIHYYYTTTWFVFFEAQKLWDNHLHFPHLPLRSWGGDGSTRFDGSALVIGLICGAYLFKQFLKKLSQPLLVISKDVSFSLVYIVATTLVVLLYRDGNLYSFNRFVYATPFIVVSINYFFDTYTFNWKHVWVLLIATEFFWLLFNSYNHIHNFVLFTTVSFYFILLLFSKHTNKLVSTLSITALILINCVGFIKLLYRFLNGGWVG